ncbi:MAG: tandem-95 repeat protein [Verrucomicrobiaceae bacterium]|nr:tandem-95 repeat protein [Verrucomicrobiaceae bacterium]
MRLTSLFASIGLTLSICTVEADTGTGLGIVNHAPNINAARVEGSLQMRLPENVNLNGEAEITREFRVPGTPTLVRNGNKTTVGSIVNGTGSASPSNYQVRMNGRASIGTFRRRVDALPLPTVPVPPAPTGTRSVNVNGCGQNIGSWNTIRNLTLNRDAGAYAVPPGNYGNFTANRESTFILGTAGATTPSVYSFQSLTINSEGRIRVVGPVIVTVDTSVTLNGESGAHARPFWFDLRLARCGLNLNGESFLSAKVTAPNGTVTLNGESCLTGSLICNYLNLNGESLLRLCEETTTTNQPPVALSQTVTTAEDSALAITLSGTDTENAPLTYTVLTQPTNGTLTGTAPALSYTPAANSTGTDSFTFRVNDGTQNSATATVSITITPVNDAPVASPQSVSLAEDTPTPITLTGSDVEGSALTYSLLSSPVRGVLSGTLPNLTYTPQANYNGPDSFTFRVSDGAAFSASATVSLTVTPVQDVPVASSLNVTLAEDASATLTLGGTDPDNDPLQIILLTQPANGVLSGSGENRIYTPAANFHGTDSFTYRVSDGTQTSAVATVSLTITPENDAPLALPATISVVEDTAKPVTLSASDVDGGLLTYQIVTPPSHGTLSGTAPALVYTPAPDFHGEDSFTFLASDGVLSSPVAAVSLTVTPVNDAPVVSSNVVTTPEDTATPIVLSASDVDGDALSYTVTTQPAHGTLSGTAPNLVFTPAENFAGTDSIGFTVSDGSVSVAGTISLVISPVNDAPLAVALTLTGSEDAALPLLLQGTDVDGDALTYTLLSEPQHGTLSGTAPALTYTPNTDFHGADGFSYVVSDGQTASAPAAVVFTITPVNDLPLAQSQGITTPEDTAVAVTLAATDVDDDTLTYQIVTQPAHGTLSGTAPAVTYTPAANYAGSDTFTFKVNDGTADSTLATVSIEIGPMNDRPYVADVAVTTPEDQSVSITADGFDWDFDALSFAVLTSPAHGSLTATAEGWTYTPEANFHGTDSFVYRANDGLEDSDPATVTITVTPVNDAPLAQAVAVSTDEDVPVSVTLLGSDLEGGTLSFEVLTQPQRGTLSGTAPALTYTPSLNQHGADTFTYRVSDGDLTSATATVTISIAPVNDSPLAQSQSLTLVEDGSVAVTLAATDDDGDALSFTLTTAPQHGTLSGTAPNVTYTPAADFHGSDSFAFTASDGTASSSPAIVTLAVTPVNDLPLAQAASFTTDEDTAVAVTLAASDVDGDALTYTIVNQPQHGTLSGTAPDLTFTPAENFAGNDSFSFKVNDGTADSAVATVSITINPVNDVPVALASTVSTLEDTAVVVSLVGTDVEGDTLTYQITQLPQNGVLSGNAPDLTFTPAANFHGADLIRFRVSDGQAQSAEVEIPITISPVNDAPLAIAGAASTPEDTAVPVLLIGTDVDGDTLSYQIVTPPAHGVLSGLAPNLTFTPALNFNGGDSFTFTVSDGTAVSAPATFTIAIGPENDAPEAFAVSVTLDEDSLANVTASTFDLDGDVLSLAVVSAPQHGTLTATSGGWTYTPEADYHGADSFTYRANDGLADSAPATVSIQINPVNDIPVASAQSRSTAEDTALNGTLSADDQDGDTLTFALQTAPQHGVVAITGSSFTYTPDADYHGADSFAFTANDGTESSAPATVSLTVTPVNDAPTATPTSATLAEDSSAAITLSGVDVENDALSFAVVVSPSHGSLSGTAPNLTYTPSADYHGADTFTFRVNDGQADSAVATVSITVNPVNDVPVAAAQSVTVAEDSTVLVTLSADDVDGDALTYQVATQPAHGTLNGLIYTPDADFNGTDSFTFTADDGTAVSAAAVVSIIVTPVNDAPVAQHALATTAEDSPVLIPLSATDSDQDTLGYTLTALPTHGTASLVNGIVTYTPDADYHGADSFSFQADDGQIVSNIATVQITITPVNDAPTANAIAVTVNEDTVLSITLSGNDVDGDALTFEVLSQPAHGTLNGLVYTPDADFSGADSFTFRASDGTAFSSAATVSITVNPVNDVPVALTQQVTTQEDTAVSITLAGSDVDGDVLTYQITTPPSHGSLSGTAPNLTYSPNADYNGNDSFAFTVADSAATSAPALVSIVVGSENDAPVASPVAVTLAEDSSANLTAIVNDAENDTLTLQVVIAPQHGTLAAIAGGWTYTPDTDYHGTDSFTYRANDGMADSAPAAVTLTITPVNDAPVAVAQAISVPEDGSVTITLTATDVDGDALSYTIATQPAHGTLNDLIYTPDADFYGDDSFTFTASDGTATSTATVSITVNPVNDVPVAQAQSLTTAEDTALPLVLAATDTEAQPLSFEVLTQPAHGVLSGSAPNLIYTPAADYHGADSFTFRASDGLADSAPATIVLTITPANDAPLAVAAAFDLNEDTAASLTLSGTDADGDVLTFTVTRQPQHGILTGTAPALVYTPAANYHGTDDFAFQVNDGAVSSAEAVVSLTVIPVNDAPLAAAGNTQSVMLDELAILAGEALDDAHPGTTLVTSWTQVSGPGQTLLGDAASPENVAQFTEPGLYVLQLNATDGELSTSDQVAITVVQPNKAPVVLAGPDLAILTTETASLNGSVTDDNLPQPVALTAQWQAVAGPGTVQFANADSAVTTATFSMAGEYVLRLFGRDGELVGADDVRVTVTVPNAAPVVNAGMDQTVDRDAPVALAGVVTDDGEPQAGTLTSQWSLVSGPTNYSLANPSAAATQAVFREAGTYVLRLAANDGALSTSDEVTIIARPKPNTAPVVNAGQDATINGRHAWLGGVVTDDGLPENAAVTSLWTQVSGPAAATFASASTAASEVSFTMAGTYVFRLSASDTDLSAQDEVTLEVMFENLAPVVNAGADRTIEDTLTGSLNGQVSDDDLPANQPVTLAWTLESGPGTAQIATTDRASSVVTVSAYGSYVFKLTANDSDESAADTVTLTFADANLAPIVDAGADQTVPYGLTYSVNLLTNPSADEALAGTEIAGWTEVLGTTWTSPVTLPVPARAGTSFFLASQDARAELAQTVDLSSYASAIDTTGQFFVFNGFVRSKDAENRADGATVVLEFRDAGGTNVLATHTMAPAPSETGWLLVTTTAQAPTGARSARVRLLAERISSTGTDVYFDDLSLRAVTLPESTFAGVVTDDGKPAGAVVTSQWSQVSGPSSFILAPAAVSSRVLFTAPGSYVFRLTGDDSLRSGSDDVLVQVESPPSGDVPPVVNAGTDRTLTLPTNVLSLTGTVTDDAFSIAPVTQAWTVVSGPAEVIFDAPRSLATQAFFSTPGLYRLKLAAFDGTHTGEDELVVEVGSTEWQVPLDLMLLVDTSGSMAGAKLVNTKLIMLKIVEALAGEGDKTALMSFTDRTTLQTTFTQDKVLLTQKINALKAEDSTNVATALADARLHMQTNGRGSSARPVIVLLTDAGTETNSAITQATLTKQAGIRIISVGIGLDAVEDTLRSISTSPAYYHYAGSDGANNQVIADRVSAQLLRGSIDGTIQVFAGADFSTPVNTTMPIYGRADFSQMPGGATQAVQWSKVHGPGNVTFNPSNADRTEVSFDTAGHYVLRIEGSSTYAPTSSFATDTDHVSVRVGLPCDVIAPQGQIATWRGEFETVEGISGIEADGAPSIYTGGQVGGSMLFTANATGLRYAKQPSWDVLANTEGFALDFWFKYDNSSQFNAGWLAGWMDTTTKNGVYVFMWAGGLDLRHSRAGSGTTPWPASVSFIQDTAWHHYCVNYDKFNGRLSIYRDGVRLANNSAGNWQTNYTTGDFYIGAPPASASPVGTVAGQLDEASLYSRPLTPSEISAIYAAGPNGVCPLGSNSAPIVDAGYDLDVPLTGTPLALKATASDDGNGSGAPLACSWTMVSGPGVVTMGSPNAFENVVSFDATGTYVLRATVADGQLTASDTISVRVGSPAVAVCPSGTLGWWRLDNDLQSAIDGTAMRASAAYTVGQAGPGLLMQGSADYAALPGDARWSFTSATSFSYDLWLKMPPGSFEQGSSILRTRGNPNRYLVLGANPVNGGILSTGVFYTGASNGSAGGAVGYPRDGGWHHLLLSYSHTDRKFRLYFDGTLRSTSDAVPASSDFSTSGDWVFNPVTDFTPAGISVGLDEFSLYNRALTATEALNIFQAGSFGKCPNPAVVNHPPQLTVTAPTSTLPQQPVQFIASAQDDGLPSGSVLTYAWTQVSGPATASLSSAANASTSVTLPVAGQYQFRVTVSDSLLSVSRDVTLIGIATANQQPVVDAGADQTLPWQSPTSYLLQGVATDDGLPADGQFETQWRQLAGPANVNYNNRTSPVTSVTFPLPGTYVLELSAFDGQFVRADEVTLTVQDPGNNAPVVTLGPDRTIATGDSLLFSGYASDDGLPRGYLAARWLQISGPAPVSMQNGTQGMSITFPAQGVYRIRAIAEDGELEGSDEVFVFADVTNAAPVVNAGADRGGLIQTALSLSGSVVDDGLPIGSSVTSIWSVVSGPAAVVFANAASPATTATFDTAGAYVLRLSATDGTLAAQDEVTVRVFDSPQAPEVTLLEPFAEQRFLAESPITLSAEATDADGSIIGVTFLVDGVAQPVDSLAPYTLTLAAGLPAGTHSIAASAEDDEGRVTTLPAITITTFVDDPAPPTLTITSPNDGSVITSPVEVTGVIESTILEQWRLETRPQDATGDWRVLASGTGTISGGVVGTLDPTLLQNGLHDLRIALDDLRGMTYTTTKTIVIDGAMKLGQFTLAFEDFTLDAPGIPISVTRSYDSRDTATVGDFGHGWKLGLRTVKLEKSGGVFGEDWAHQQVGSVQLGFIPLPIYAMQATRAKRVAITFPDGRCEIFEATIASSNYQGISVGPVALPALEPNMQYGTPINVARIHFRPLNGSRGSLAVAGGQNRMFNPGGVLGSVTLLDETDPTRTFDASAFVFTDDDATEYTLDDTPGLQKVKDRNGNELSIASGEIAHSNGQRVLFTRDGQGRITTLTDPAGAQITYGYNALGTLSTVTDRVGNVTTFQYENATFPYYLTGILDPRGTQAVRTEYDAEGRMTRQVDADGNAIVLTHNVAARTQRVTDRLGEITTHTFDLRGNITRSVDALGGVTTRTYDAFDNEITTTDPLGHTTRRTFDAQKNVLTETDALGNVTRYTYNSKKQPLTITDPLGRVTSFAYDSKGNMTSITDALGRTTGFVPTSNGSISRLQFPGGTAYDFSLDSSGNKTSQVVRGADGKVNAYQTFTYNSNGDITSQADYLVPSGATDVAAATKLRENAFAFNAEGNMTAMQVKDAAGNVLQSQSWTYNANGDEVTYTDPLGKVSTQEYDAQGRNTRSTYPDGTESRLEYDAEDNIIRTVNRSGGVMLYEFDALGRQTKQTNVDGTFTTSTFDAAGREISKTNELGQTTILAYDDADRLVSETNAAGETMTYTLDAAGNNTAVTDALNRTTSTLLDLIGRPTRTDNPDGTFAAVVYDAAGRIATRTDEAGSSTHFEYDPQGRLLAVLDALGQRTSMVYDSAGRLQSWTDAMGNTTSYTHDTIGRRTSRTLPGGQTENMTWDSLGRLLTRTDFNGYTTSYFYDDDHRLVEKRADAGHPSLSLPHAAAKVLYTYNQFGQPATAQVLNASGGVVHSQSWSYDDHGQLIGTTTPHGSLGYTRDDLGQIASLATSHAEGPQLTYARDNANRIAAIEDHRTAPTRQNSFSYTLAGALSHATVANGMKHSFTRNTRDYVTALGVTDAANAGIESFNYTLNALGQRERIDEGNGRVVQFQRDALSRLTQESMSNVAAPFAGTINYTHNANGYRTQRASTQPSVPNQTFTLNANGQLDSASYDANGNTTVSGGNNDIYDFEDRLIRRIKSDGTVIDLVYDANGQRVEKRIAPSAISNLPSSRLGYLIDTQNPTGWPQCVAELQWQPATATWEPQTTYTYGPAGPISQWSVTQGEHHFLLDAHGTVRALVDATGQVVSSMDYDSHGVPLSVTPVGAPNSSLGYNGEHFDADLGLIYLRARWYNPTVGRFHTRDPYQGMFEDPMSLQGYLFAHGDPESMIDPSGNFSLAEILNNIRIMGQKYAQQIMKLEDRADPAIKSIGTLWHALNYTASWESLLSHAIPDYRPGTAPGSLSQWTNQGVALIESSKYNADLVKHFRTQVNQTNKREFAERMVYFGDLVAKTSGSLLESTQWKGRVYQKINGMPEFTPFTISSKSTFINKGFDSVDKGRGLSGSRSGDDAAAGSKSHLLTKGTWHHHEVIGIMQLVPSDLNHGSSGISHYGGVAFWKLFKNTSGKYSPQKP